MPKSSEISWGLCVPSSCSSDEVSSFLKQKIVEVTNIPKVYWKVQIETGNCRVRDENWIRNMTIEEKLAM